MPDPEIDVIREILASRPRPRELSERRRRLDALGSQYPLPADVRVEAMDANGVAAEWTTTPEADRARVILFLHGGGYISGSLDSHRHMIAQAGREARACTLALGNRLAPERPFPGALEDTISGYRFLLAHGFQPRGVAPGATLRSYRVFPNAGGDAKGRCRSLRKTRYEHMASAHIPMTDISSMFTV